MKPSTPREKWSARQLLVALKEAEAKAKAPSKSAANEVRRLRAETERAHAREAALVAEVAALRGEADAEGIAPDELGGRPSLAKYRGQWRRFAHAVYRLPDIYRSQGHGPTVRAITNDLLADLHLFELDAPRGSLEARERDRVRRMLSSPTFQALLMEPAPWADRFRRQFVEQVTRSFLRPSIWRLYEKAADEGVLDRAGTVFK